MISIKEIKKVLSIQATAIRSLEKYIGTSYEKAVEAIYRCKGKLVITGIGKSGIVAQKISATFSSTGTPSIFLHPVEAMHGNIGILHRNDLVLAIGKSGESEEILNILPPIRKLGLKLLLLPPTRTPAWPSSRQLYYGCRSNGRPAP